MTSPAVDAREFTLSGDPARARDTVASALAARGFAVTWADDWTGTATRGSKRKQAVFGAFAQYFEVGLGVMSAGEATVVRITRPAAGWTGGLAGRQRAVSSFRKLGEELEQTFANAGVLRP